MKEILDDACTHDASDEIGGELAESLHLTFPEAYQQAASMAALSLAIKERDGLLFCTLPFCHTVEGEALGGQIHLGNEHIGPRAGDYICKTAEDILSLEAAAYTRGRMGAVLAACKELSDRGEIVSLNVSGPFTILNVLMDAMDMFRMLRKEPELSRLVLDKLRFFQLGYLKQAKASGVKIISYADSAGAFNIVGPKMAGEVAQWFTVPFLREAAAIAERDMLLMLCPKTAYWLIESGAAYWESVKLPNAMDYGAACKWAVGKVDMVGQTCSKNIHYPLKDGFLKSIQLVTQHLAHLMVRQDWGVMRGVDVIETQRMQIVEACEGDIETIIALESHRENRDYLWIGTREEHLAEISDPNHLLLVFRRKSDEAVVGYALVRLDFKSHIFELRRIAISEKKKGYGREAMDALVKYAFEETETNRFWLDVYPDNLIGIKLYESMGMHRDGMLRQNYKAERGYLDQIIYSMLRDEYKA